MSDEELALHVHMMLLEHEGYHVLAAASESAAAELLDSSPINLALLDYRALNVAERVATKLRERRPGLHILLMSFTVGIPENLAGLIDDTVSKSRHPDVLLRKIEHLLRKSARKAR